jgi:hypothetical protein
MSNIYDVNERMHKMRVRLYPNYLPGGEGTFIARTANEAAVTNEDICAAMKNRAGYPGSYDELIQAIHHYYKEMRYQLADGFTVNTDLFTIHPNIGGVFKSDKDPIDPKQHPMTFRFQSLRPLRNLHDEIDVIIEGFADTPAWISEFTDHESHSTNYWFEPDHMFTITGHKIKLEGSDPKVGVYFVPILAPQDAVKVDRIGENTASRVTGIIPYTGYMKNRIEIRTLYAGSGSITLKTLRIITSNFVLEQV